MTQRQTSEAQKLLFILVLQTWLVFNLTKWKMFNEILFNTSKNLKDDLQRHKVTEQQLIAKIAVLEQLADPVSVTTLNFYIEYLGKLRDSRGKVVEKIGRK